MIIKETTTRSINTVVGGYVIEISRTDEKYAIAITPLAKDQTTDKNKIVELADKIKLLIDVVSKGD